MGALFQSDSLRRSWGLFHVVVDDADLRFRLDSDLRRRGALADLRSWLSAGRVLIVPAVLPFAIQRRDPRPRGASAAGFGNFFSPRPSQHPRPLFQPLQPAP